MRKKQIKSLANEQKQRTKQQQKLEKEARVKKKREILQSVDAIFPIADWDVQNFGKMKNGKIVDFFQIACKNLNALSDDEANYDYIKWDKLYMTYPYDLKVIVLNLPLDLSLQKKAIKTIAQRTENDIFYKKLEEEFMFLEELSGSLDREYFLFFYADDYADYIDKKSKIKSCLNRGNNNLCMELPREKKEQVLYKLNNMNSKLIIEE